MTHQSIAALWTRTHLKPLPRMHLVESPTSVTAFVLQVRHLERVGFEVLERARQLEVIHEMCGLVDTHRIEAGAVVRKQATTLAREFGEFRQWSASKEIEVVLGPPPRIARRCTPTARWLEALPSSSCLRAVPGRHEEHKFQGNTPCFSLLCI